MAKNVDEKIVQMTFDNARFERNVKETMSTLDKLKQSLRFKGVENGFDNINKAASKVDIDGNMGRGIDSVKMKFSALEIFAVTAMGRISNSVITMGKNLISSFTLDPIKSGLSEYETLINATQTIQANTKFKGTSMDEINSALAELNEYADKTIYNFTEMTKNIGTFTAAGVDLDKAVRAIKGLSNLAGMSGAQRNQLSNAMFQMSQMMSAGRMMTMDWNSLVNANMASETLQKSIIETARLRGVAIDALMEEKGSFKASLETGWLTSDIFLETIQKFSGELSDEQLLQMGYTQEQIVGIQELAKTAVDATTQVKTFTQLMDTLKESTQSGWTNSWKLIIGDFEESKTLWTGVYGAFDEIIQKMAESRNKILSDWRDAGGRDAMLNSFVNVFNALKNVIVPVKEAFREIFPRKTGEEWAKISKSIEKFTKSLILSEKNVKRVKDVFKGLFTVLKVIVKPIEMLVKPLWTLTYGVFRVLGQAVLSVGGAFGNLNSKFNDFANKYKIFETINKYISIGMQYVEKYIVKLLELIRNFELTETVMKYFNQGLSWIKSHGGDAFDILKKAIVGCKDEFEIVKNAIGGFIQIVGDGAEKIFEFFSRMRDNAKEASTNVIETFKSVGGSSIDFIDSLDIGEKIKMVFGGVAAAIGWVISKIKDITLKDITTVINTAVLYNMGTSISDFFDALSNTIMNVSGIVEKIQDILGGVKGVLEEYQKSIKADILMKIAKAIAILTGSLVVLSLIDASALLKSVGVVSALFGELVAATALMNLMKLENTAKISMIIGAFSFAVLLLSGAMFLLSRIDDKKMNTGIKGMIGIAISMSIFFAVIGNMRNNLSKAPSTLIAMGIAINLFAAAMYIISTMNWKELKRSVGAMVSLMGAMALFLNSLNYIDASTAKAPSTLLAMSIALIGMSAALKILAGIDVDGLGIALGALATILVSFVLFAKTTNAMDMYKLSILGKTLMKTSFSMVLFATAFSVMGSIKMSSLIKSLGVFGAVLFGISKLSQNAGGGRLGVTNMNIISMAVSLIIVAKAIKMFEKIKIASVGKALLGLGGAIGIMAGGLLLFRTAMPGATAFLAASAGVLALAMAFKTLGEAMQIFQLIGNDFGKILIDMFDGLTMAAPSMGKAFITMIRVAIQEIVGGIPDIARDLAKIIIDALTAVLEFTDDLVNVVCKLLVKVFDGVAANAPKLVDSAVTMLLKILESVFGAMNKMSGGNIDAMIHSLGKLSLMIVMLGRLKQTLKDSLISVGLLSACIGILSIVMYGLSKLPADDLTKTCESTSKMITSLSIAMKILSFVPVSGAITGIAGLSIFAVGLTALLAVLGGIRQIPGCDWLINEGSEFLSKLGYALGDFIGSIAGGLLDGVTSGLPAVGQNMTDFMTNIQGFIAGAKEIDAKSMEGVKSLATAMLIITGNEILDSLTSFITGGVDWKEFSVKVVSLGKALVAFSQSVDGIKPEDVEKAANAGLLLTKLADTVPNEGGLLSWIVGDNKIDEFARKLPKLAEGLVGFSNKIKEGEIDPACVESAVNACKLLTELADTVPNEGGLLSWIVGDNKIDEFGAKLPILAAGLVGFAIQTKDIKPESIQGAINATELIIALNQKIPETGGIWGLIKGDNSLEDFGEQLKVFGKALAEYGKAVKDIKADKITATIESVDSMTKVVTKLTDVDYTGLEPFNTCVPLFGETIFNFYDSVSAINIEVLQSAIASIQSLSDMLNNIGQVNSVQIKEFVKALEDLSKVSIETLVSGIQNGSSSVVNALSSMFVDMRAKVSESKLLLINTFNISIQEIITRINGHRINFENAGRRLVEGFCEGMNTSNTGVTSRFIGILNNCINTIRGYRLEFYIAGMHVVRGFADGISDTTFLAVAKAGQMASKAVDKAKNVLDEHSPSRVFRKIGKFVAMGMALGIDDYSKKVEKSSSNLGYMTINAIDTSMKMANDIIENGVNSHPTIIPILNLEEIQNGMASLKDGFINTSLNMAGNINVTRRNNEFDDIKNSIGQLVNGITSLNDSERVYNINSDVILDGKKVGRGTAVYVQNELNRIKRSDNRKGGIK